jgi:threonine dehydratase
MVGGHNWPILQRLVKQAVAQPDASTQAAMRWLYQRHGLRTEPSGAIAVAALLERKVDLGGEGDLVIVISGRNVDDETFRVMIDTPNSKTVKSS